jgi:hypothetical protein
MTTDIPNWMKAKMEKESIKAKPKRKAVAKKPRAAKPPKPPKPPRPPKLDWTVAVKIYESKAKNPKLRRGVIAHLRYRGERVHTLTGALAESTLKEEAKVLNERKYTPDCSRVKLYCEMNDGERTRLAAKHSPELQF